MIQIYLDGTDANVAKSTQLFAASTQVFYSLAQTPIGDVQSYAVSPTDFSSLQVQLSIRYTSHIDARDGSNFQAQLRRPRYRYHIRYEQTTKYARPDVLVQYKHKRWKQPPDSPQEPESPPKAKTPIRAMLHNANKE
ncbi:hypothetical protein BGW41_005060 [Actinomortierella wolfii]|nr:hypothetical protein BGW41_005060 [Actinomortierella wolfii]